MYDITKLKDILEKYNVNCPICDARNFTAEKNPGTLNGIDLENNSVSVGSGFAVAILHCNNCGFVLFFTASKFQ